MALNTNPRAGDADVAEARRPAARPDVAEATLDEERLGALEAAARAAIEAITITGEQRLAAAVDRAETRVMDALSMVEQTRAETTRWRASEEETIHRQLRELGEWDESLTETRNDITGLREMAEAALGVASDDLDRRWDDLRRELADVLATAESDERARWEAFMAGATETLASSAGIDPAEVDALRIAITNLSATAAETTERMRLAQREQLAALRVELRTLVESERGQIITGVDHKLEDARRLFSDQSTVLREWQERVEREVVVARESALAADQRARETVATLRHEAQAALGAIHDEVERGVAQARTAARAEIGAMQSETHNSLKAVKRSSRSSQILALLVALIALALAAAALALPLLRLP